MQMCMHGDKQPSTATLAITTEDLHVVEGLHAPVKARVAKHQEHLPRSVRRVKKKQIGVGQSPRRPAERA